MPPYDTAQLNVLADTFTVMIGKYTLTDIGAISGIRFVLSH